MSYYAKIEDGIVTKVISAEAEFFEETAGSNNYVDDTPGEWVKTSYNMRGGVYHIDNVPAEDQSVIEGDEARQRKNYAGIGFSYDQTRDAFIPPKPYPSWVLNETTCLWDAPVAYPDDGNMYQWNEETTSWDEITE